MKDAQHAIVSLVNELEKRSDEESFFATSEKENSFMAGRAYIDDDEDDYVQYPGSE